MAKDDFLIEEGVLLKYTGVKADVFIPVGVTKIGEFAFHCDRTITSVRISDTVKVIADSAFAGCSKLGTVIFGKGVTSIGCNAFSSCGSLSSLVFPENIEKIDSEAFSSCTFLSSVKFCNPEISLHPRAFEHCKNIFSVSFPVNADKTVVEILKPYVLKSSWKSKGLCEYCGGSFYSYRNNVCRTCGRLK